MIFAAGRNVQLCGLGPGLCHAQLGSLDVQRKSLRDRWLMDRAVEEPEGPDEPPTPETQAQARIQNLEGSLFT